MQVEPRPAELHQPPRLQQGNADTPLDRCRRPLRHDGKSPLGERHPRGPLRNLAALDQVTIRTARRPRLRVPCHPNP